MISRENRNLTGSLSGYPRINATPAYGSNGYMSVGTSAQEGVSGVIGVTKSIYTNTGSFLNGSDCSDCNYSITSSPSTSKFTNSGSLNNTGGLSWSTNLPTVDSNTDYTISITLTDGNSSVTETHTITVKNNGTSDSGDASSSGGGSSNYGLLIAEYNKQMTLSQGETTSTTLVAKNSGIYSLDKVSLTIVGFESSWYDTTVSGSGSTSVDLSSEEVVTFDIEFDIPNDAEAKVYPATWRVRDSDGNAMAEKNTNITISEVWTGTTISGLNSTIETLEGNFSEVIERVNKLKKKGNATELEDALAEINESIEEAKTKYAEGDYSGAQDAIDRANELIDNLEADLDELKTIPFEGVSFGKLGVAIFIIIIAAIAGILVWYKFMRLVPISEIKKYPDRFLEGARLEGVVKGTTDTKKGKVFLVKDHTGKIHVRYPYYTTVEEGNMIRAQGVVKIYKGTAYMDATDIHRVAVTGKHSGDPLTSLKKKLTSIKRNLKKKIKK
ncbi:MAG: hypothetical protein R6U26_03450 [Candidatus Undinarchaeales archaeon]